MNPRISFVLGIGAGLTAAAVALAIALIVNAPTERSRIEKQAESAGIAVVWTAAPCGAKTACYTNGTVSIDPGAPHLTNVAAFWIAYGQLERAGVPIDNICQTVALAREYGSTQPNC